MVCDSLYLNALVFRSFWFSVSTWCFILKEAVPRLLPGMGEPRCLEQSMINCVLNLVASLWQVSSLTVFIWIRFILHSFDFACLRDVRFWKRLFRGSSQEWVNPGASNTQWLASFSIFEFDLDLIRSKRSFFEWACFSTLLILHVYLMFPLERGCSAALPRNGWTLVPRTVND